MKVPVAVAWSDDIFDLIVRGMMRKPTDDIYGFSSFLGLVTELSQGCHLKMVSEFFLVE